MPRAIAWHGPQSLLSGRPRRPVHTNGGYQRTSHRGTCEASRKNHRVRNAGRSGAFVVTESRVSKTHLAHEAAGASCVRRSARPLQKRVLDEKNDGAPAPERTGVVLHASKPARIIFCANGASAKRAAANNRGDGACLTFRHSVARRRSAIADLKTRTRNPSLRHLPVWNVGKGASGFRVRRFATPRNDALKSKAGAIPIFAKSSLPAGGER